MGAEDFIRDINLLCRFLNKIVGQHNYDSSCTQSSGKEVKTNQQCVGSTSVRASVVGIVFLLIIELCPQQPSTKPAAVQCLDSHICLWRVAGSGVVIQPKPRTHGVQKLQVLVVGAAMQGSRGQGYPWCSVSLQPVVHVCLCPHLWLLSHCSGRGPQDFWRSALYH